MNKYITLICILYLSNLILSAQNLPPKESYEKVDSLKLELEKEIKEEVRLNIYADIIQTLDLVDPEKATEYAHILIEEATLGEDFPPVAFAKQRIARTLINQGHLDSSMTILKETLEAGLVSNNKKLIRRAYMLLGNCADDKGDYEMALKYWEDGLEFAYSYKDSMKQAESVTIFANNLGNLYKGKLEYDKAIEYYDLAVLYCSKDSTLKNYKGVILNNLGALQNLLGDQDKAISNLLESRRIKQSIGNKLGVLFTEINLFESYFSLGEYDKILEESISSLAASQNFNNPYFITWFSSIRAKCFLEKSEHKRSLKLLEDNYTYATDYQIPTDATINYLYNYASALYANQNLVEAKKKIDLAQKILDETEDKSSLGNVLSLRLNISNKLGDTKSVDSIFSAYEKYSSKVLESNYSKLGEIEARYTNLENQQKVELLEKDKVILQARSNRNKLIAIMGSLSALIIGLFYWRNRKQAKLIKENNVQLQNLNETKDRLFSIIGHDLKKPVLSFRGITEKIKYLTENNEQEKLLKFSASIEKEAVQLNKLTDNLLSWALLQKNLLDIKNETIELKPFIQETISLFDKTASLKQIKINTDIPDIMIKSDRHALSTIVRNLVDNAIKFSPIGERIDIVAKMDKEELELSVSDNGMGLSDEKMKSIFTLSKQKSTKGTSGESGTGLGLHLVKELIEKCGGKISVQSRQSQGTEFILYLPH